MRAPYVNPEGFRFTIYWKNLFSDLGKLLGEESARHLVWELVASLGLWETAIDRSDFPDFVHGHSSPPPDSVATVDETSLVVGAIAGG